MFFLLLIQLIEIMMLPCLIAFFLTLVIALAPIAIIAVPIVLIVRENEKKIKEYESTSYYQITKTSYSELRHNDGKMGEYIIFRNLQHMEQQGARFLFNLYVPKLDGTTTEIDVLMICPRGIIVFESKNYSGWIFGNENHKTWTQTLSGKYGHSQKFNFFNPIMQNKHHIKYLRKFIESNIHIESIVAFSNRCEFKDLELKNENIYVVHYTEVEKAVMDILNKSNGNVLNDEQIEMIYNKLFPLTQVTDYVKEKHIQDISKE